MSIFLNFAPFLSFLFFLLVGNAKAADIREQTMDACNLRPSATAPGEYENKAIPARVNFLIDRLIDIDDVEESLAFTGGMMITMQIDCLANFSNYMNQTGHVVPDYWMSLTSSDFWIPKVVNLNSKDDYGLNTKVAHAIQAYPFRGFYIFTITGIITQFVKLNFYDFPWGSSSCVSNFGIILPKSLLAIDPNVNIQYVTGKNDFITKNFGWTLTNMSATVMTQDDGYGSSFYTLTLTLDLERRPEYYLSNIVAPCLIITFVQLGIIIMPSDQTARSTFSITVLLSFTLIQTLVLANIPLTPAPVLLSHLILIETISSVVFTFYAAITCAFVDSFPDRATKNINIFNKFNVRLCRLVDFVAFCLFLTLLVIINMTFLLKMMYHSDN